MKKPDVLIVNQGLNSLGAREQGEIISTIIEQSESFMGRNITLIWAPVNPAFSEYFGRVIVFDSGSITGDGKPEELKNNNPVYQDLLS